MTRRLEIVSSARTLSAKTPSADILFVFVRIVRQWRVHKEWTALLAWIFQK